ncbi:MAG: hypothetical protein MUE53_06870 [Chitinophagales bacterium]|jgi:hypothetical protein|nr:hypothetical protein [Chitinophagales bacterium]
MKIIPYCLGLLSASITAFIVYSFNQWSEFQFHTLSILFVFPVGALIIGFFGASGLFLGKKWTNSKMYQQDYFIAVLLGFIAYFGIYYLSYSFTYFSNDLDEVRFITQFERPQNYISISETIPFWDYLVLINNSSSSQLMLKGVKLGDPIEFGGIFSKIIFLIQFIGVVIGALAIMLFLSSQKYCETCEKYYLEKVLKRFKPINLEDIVNRMNQNLGDGISLNQEINQLSPINKEDKTYGQLDLEYCPKCHKANFVFKFFEKNAKGVPNEINDFRNTIEIKAQVARALLNV